MQRQCSARVQTGTSLPRASSLVVPAFALLALLLASAAAAAPGGRPSAGFKKFARVGDEVFVEIVRPIDRSTVQADDNGNVLAEVLFGANADLSSFEASIKQADVSSLFAVDPVLRTGVARLPLAS